VNAGPIRTCTGCGRKAPKSQLVRFVAAGDRLEFGPRAQGRGAYTCRRRSCFERASARRAFNRTLRQTLRVDPALAIYTEHD